MPVPLYSRRKRWRGFNQAEILARVVSEYFHSELNIINLNKEIIRSWKMCNPPVNKSAVLYCTREEIIELETTLGELKTIEFIEHPTRGLVVKG